jgi:prepilin-type N-terminal cleavage/methylation domain-containing protein
MIFFARKTIAQSGFTLIEIVISTALMSMVLGAAYVCLNAAFSTRRMVEQRAEVLQNARVALDRISADLRSACPLSKDIPFLGMRRDMGGVPADNLDFGTHNYRPRKAHEGDFCETSYFLHKDEETGLYAIWRRRDPTPDEDPTSGGRQEEIAAGVMGLRFDYYDGLDWYEEWGDATGKKQFSNRDHPNMVGMPEAVRITILMDSEYSNGRAKTAGVTNGPPLALQTVARLNLAATAQQTSGSSDSSAQMPAAPQPGGPQ